MTEPNLASLQAQFADALEYKEHHLPILLGVAKPDSLMQIYRNNFIISLSQCLSRTYPVVLALIGETCFQALDRHHIIKTPMTNVAAQHYGRSLDKTILSIPNIIAAAPYLADIATLEWNIHQINALQLSSFVFPVDALSRISADDFTRIQLHVSPLIRVMQSAFPVGQIWKAIINKDEKGLSNITLTEAESLIIERKEEGVMVRTIDVNEAALIEKCKKGPLNDISPSLLLYIPSAMAHKAFTGFSLRSEEKGKST